MNWQTKVSDDTDGWVVTFGLIFRKRSYSCTVEAVNVRTREKLRMPQDRERLTAILPWDDWPPFATQKFRNPTHPEQTERLF